MRYVIAFAALIFHTSCDVVEKCEIHELTHAEMYEMALKGEFLSENIPTYSTSGFKISRDSLLKYDRDEFALSQFKDCRDSIVKMVVRPINSNDIVLRDKIDSLYSSNLDLAIKRIKYVAKDTTIQKKMIKVAIFDSPPVLTKVNCDTIKQLLSSAFNKGQDNRRNIDLLIDKENLNLVESITEFCGIEAIEELGEESIYQFFMIIQHGPAKYRKKYFSFFKSCTDNGLLNKSTFALLVDRTLLEENKKQIYGTQYKKNSRTGDIELYPLKDSARVDSFRNDMGLEPLEQYLEIIKSRQ